MRHRKPQKLLCCYCFKPEIYFAKWAFFDMSSWKSSQHNAYVFDLLQVCAIVQCWYTADVTVPGILSATGNTTLSCTLTVTGTMTLNNTLKASPRTFVNNSILSQIKFLSAGFLNGSTYLQYSAILTSFWTVVSGVMEVKWVLQWFLHGEFKLTHSELRPSKKRWDCMFQTLLTCRFDSIVSHRHIYWTVWYFKHCWKSGCDWKQFRYSSHSICSQIFYM